MMNMKVIVTAVYFKLKIEARTQNVSILNSDKGNCDEAPFFKSVS